MQPVMAQTEIPPVANMVFDDFESGNLGYWTQSASANLNLVAGGGRDGSVGLSVPINSGSKYLYQEGVFRATEGYVTFWFNPNGVSIPEPVPNYWPPETSLTVAEVLDSGHWWPSIVSLHVRRPPGQGYKAYLSWPTSTDGSRQYDYDHAFDLSSGWQKITVGYRIDGWVAVWLNDVLMRSATNVVHVESYGDIVVWGKTRETVSTPSGSLRFDDLSFQTTYVKNLWVDASTGNDNNTGLTYDSAFKTIQKAAAIAGPGTTVRIMPGVYRGAVSPSLIGNSQHSVIYKAENGPGTVKLRGSVAAWSLTWTQLTENTIGLPPGVDPTNLYYTDLSSWGLTQAPRFVVELDANGEVYARYPLAREPDWDVTTEWKYHEFWWAANGGSYAAVCDPSTDSNPECDKNSRSTTQLTDTANDSGPSGIETGNLTTLGNLSGATLVALDALQGHYIFRRTIASHNVSAGRITVDRACMSDVGSGDPGLGWGTKYYVENKPYLLDTPGEWWYDTTTKRLYLWPRLAGNPANRAIEISRYDYGFNLRHRSYTVLNGLTIEFQNHSSVFMDNFEYHRSYGNMILNSLLRYANYGVYMAQSSSSTTPSGYRIDGFTMMDSEIAYMDTLGIQSTDWWLGGAQPDDFTGSRVLNTSIRFNTFHHLGFRSDNDDAVGMAFTYANKLLFEGNSVHHIAHNGLQISKSVVQSTKTYDFPDSAIKTGDIVIKNNTFSKACQLGSDCGGLKIWGSPSDAHVFRNLLVTGNVFRNNFGWSYASEKRRRWVGGSGSVVRGLGGFGMYVDMASGVHAYRNIAYNNGYAGFLFSGVWRDGLMVFVNNVSANNFNGFILGGREFDTHGNVDTRILNNIMVNNEGFGTVINYASGRYYNIQLNYNLYYNNGWRSYEDGGLWISGAMSEYEGDTNTPFETLAEAQAATPWEDNGVAGDPAFWIYSMADHDLFDGSWPDFHLYWNSPAVDKGTATLPYTLRTMLALFDLTYDYTGSAYDIGRYEQGFSLETAPSANAVDLQGTATYRVKFLPSDLPYTVTLAVSSPSPLLSVSLDKSVIVAGEFAMLSVTDHHLETIMLPGMLYTIPITGVGNGLEVTTSVSLIVGGCRIRLPLVLRNAGTEAE
ncbi:MAG: right-handed parallel beta-helix repeat-containing protein [Anaerolineae bacterium]|nr:right-handed parallel beta-helix repeat-containing protein [Anaerolineae bacterium]